MTDTPETDHLENALGNAAHPTVWSFCRKLERERDEARGQLSAAKREAENLATSIYRAEYSNVAPNWGLCDSVAGVISQIDNMYAGVRSQRDEARQQRDEYKAALQSADNHNHEIATKLEIVTEQRDGLHELHNKNAARSKELLELCETLREQRDRLAKILQNIRSGYGGQIPDPDCNCGDCEFLIEIDTALLINR